MPTVKENLQELHRVITAYPEDQLNLRNYHTCGTIFCAVGLAATLPFFMDQMGMPAMNPEEGQGSDLSFNNIASDLSDMKEIWGEDAFERLFATHGQGVNDEMFPLAHGNDKALILARIEYALAHDV